MVYTACNYRLKYDKIIMNIELRIEVKELSTYIRFLYDLFEQFFSGIINIFMGFFNGIIKMFNFKAYLKILKEYSGEFSVGQWILVGLAVLLILAFLLGIIYLVFLVIRKIFKFKKTLVEQESLLEEVAKLDRDVIRLNQEKEELYALKVSQIGLKPQESSLNIDVPSDVKTSSESGNTEGEVSEGEESSPEMMTEAANGSRFFKLTQIDEEYANKEPENFGNTFTLEELCDTFRNFAASRMKLYYKIKIIRLFVAALGATRLVILQGISGTGKTSLPYAWGKFISRDATIASVQPSWRDRTELFGYFNEFTKKFNETEVLKAMYEASYNDEMYLTILDEMNIARVEYYFAEMLSILEMPSRDEWVIDLVPNVWPNDPKHLPDGKLKIPDNMWYIGTINNDDSTFMVTDKVYDRAMPIDINDKGQPFDAPDTEGIRINSSYLESLFNKAKQEHAVSQDTLNKLEDMDNYVIEHFRLAFGNRIVKHIKEFIPVYVACGGSELDGFDYILCKKVLRKFEQLNLSFIRDEIDGYVKFLDKTFGKENMTECKEYLARLKKAM